jgi:transposase-like protein
MKENPAEGIMVFGFPLEHRYAIRSNHSLERINEMIHQLIHILENFSKRDSHISNLQYLINPVIVCFLRRERR